TFADGTFAISSSEKLIHHVIDRKTVVPGRGPELAVARGTSEKFQVADRRLPAQAFARLFVDPRLIENLIKNDPKPLSPGEALIRRYIGALDSVGAALVIRNGHLTVDIAEIVTPRQFHELLDRWSGGVDLSAFRLDNV